jgi:hypothetical protein
MAVSIGAKRMNKDCAQSSALTIRVGPFDDKSAK